MDNAFQKLEIVHKPKQDKPWLELEYTDPSNLDKFVTFVNALDNVALLNEYRQPFFFRGQANSEWTLKPRIDRLLGGMPLAEALQREFEAICYFRERAHVFVSGLVPSKDDWGEWLCLMQHFSAPTRLLDWTTSFSIALYFAATDAPLELPGAVWFFPTGPLQKWMDERYPESDLREAEQEVLLTEAKFVDFGVSRARHRILRRESERKSDRIMAQRGVFTQCEKLFADHASLVGLALMEGSMNGGHLPLCKIVVSPQAKRFFRQYLSKLNITAMTLFPGIDGLGRAICETLRVEREVYEDISRTSAENGIA